VIPTAPASPEHSRRPHRNPAAFCCSAADCLGPLRSRAVASCRQALLWAEQGKAGTARFRLLLCADNGRGLESARLHRVLKLITRGSCRRLKPTLMRNKGLRRWPEGQLYPKQFVLMGFERARLRRAATPRSHRALQFAEKTRPLRFCRRLKPTLIRNKQLRRSPEGQLYPKQFVLAGFERARLQPCRRHRKNNWALAPGGKFYPSSFFASKSFTSPGLACPFDAFITCPTK
jgi:hypothetical protein